MRTTTDPILLTLMISLTVLIAGEGVTAQGARASETRLYDIIDRAWDFRATPRPLDSDSDKDDDRLDDVSFEAIDARQMFWRATVDQLDEIEPASLSGNELVNYRIFRFIAQDELEYYIQKRYLFPFNAEGGFHTGFAFRANGTLRDSSSATSYLIALQGFRQYVHQHIVIMRHAIEMGFVMPEVLMEGFDETALSYVDAPSNSAFMKPLVRGMSNFNEADYNMWSQELSMAVDTSVNPGYTELADFLKNEYIPASSQTIGVSEIPGGKELYQQRVAYFTTVDMTPKDVFDVGMTEVARIRSEMEAIIDELDFDGDFAAFLEFLRTDPQFYASTPRELLAEASYHAKRIDGMLPQYFNTLPRKPYGVAPVPDEIAPRYTGGRYVPGRAGSSGTYWVNTYNLSSRPLYVLPSLTLHEAVPGHHLQISLAAEIDAGHRFRKQYYISAFGEGWALYTEFLGKEMGVYETPYERFGALTYEMWRACRLVVDPGMHAFGWTREEAVDFMASNTALSMHEVNTEINRYIGWPGQAVSYKIGELKIRELREDAERALGSAFDLKMFHDKLLENGSVPLFVLEEVMAQWIAQQLSKSH